MIYIKWKTSLQSRKKWSFRSKRNEQVEVRLSRKGVGNWWHWKVSWNVIF